MWFAWEPRDGTKIAEAAQATSSTESNEPRGIDMMGRVEPGMTKPTISTESKNTGGDHQRGKEVNDSAWPDQNPEKSNVQRLWKKREPVHMIEFQ
jgi:hypothetical protein